MTGAVGLSTSASRGAAVTLLGQGARVAVLLTGVVVLARLLEPKDYGLLAMVMAFTGVADVVRDFGLTNAAVRTPHLTAGQRTNLFWLSAGIGLALAVVVLAASPLVAAFYGDPRLQGVTAWLALTFLINGLITQYKADLNRTMRFGALTGVEVAGQVVGLATAVSLALAGAGYRALVAQQLVQLLAQLVLLLAVARWLPRRWARGEPVRPFVRFGANLVGGQMLGYAGNHVDTVVIGATLGATPLGLYNRAYQLLVLPLHQLNAPMTRVALPVLARLQDQPARYRQFLLTGQTAMLNVVTGLLAFAAAQAPAVVLVALGPRWTETAGLFQVLAIGGFFVTAGYACYWVYLSLGLAREQLRLSLVTAPVQVVCVLVGSQWGLYGVAWGWTLGALVQWPANLWWLHRVSDAPIGAVLRNGVRTVLVHGWALAASWTATRWLAPGATWSALLIGAAALVAALGLAALVVPAFRRDLRTVAGLPRYLRARPAAAAPADAAPADAAPADGTVPADGTAPADRTVPAAGEATTR